MLHVSLNNNAVVVPQGDSAKGPVFYRGKNDEVIHFDKIKKVTAYVCNVYVMDDYSIPLWLYVCIVH